MKISKREMIIGVATLITVLFGLTYWIAGSSFAEQRTLTEEKARLERQIKLHTRILEEKESWMGQLQELQKQLPAYEPNVSVTGEILKNIKRMADQNNLDLTKSRSEPEKQVGSLYEISVSCDWEGELDALVRFLYDVHKQGIRYDIRDFNVRPDAKRIGILRGGMTIDCAFRREASNSEAL
jgi:Tfp pilus assembly protein PilO